MSLVTPSPSLPPVAPCPDNHFGPSCAPCPAITAEGACNGHGECVGGGTNRGSGTCRCDDGYVGSECATPVLLFVGIAAAVLLGLFLALRWRKRRRLQAAAATAAAALAPGLGEGGSSASAGTPLLESGGGSSPRSTAAWDDDASTHLMMPSKSTPLPSTSARVVRPPSPVSSQPSRGTLAREVSALRREAAEAQRAAAAARAEAEDAQTCKVCLDAANDTALGCGHVYCGRCAAALRACPLCRVPVTSTTRVYL